MKEVSKFKDLSIQECQDINGGIWPLILEGAEIIGAFAVGYSIGFGWGSYDCDCEDGRRLDEIGPTHNIA